MMSGHATDTEIQEYVLDKAACDAALADHIDGCETCRTAAANYRMLFPAIKEMALPVFDFDPVVLVLSALPKPKRQRVWGDCIAYVIFVAAFAALGIPVYLYYKELSSVFDHMMPVTVLFLALPITGIFAFQCYEMYRDYKKKIAVLH